MLCTALSKLQSNTILSVFFMAFRQVDACRWLGPRFTVSIDFYRFVTPWNFEKPISFLRRGWFLLPLLRSSSFLWELRALFPALTAQDVGADAAILNS